MSYLSIRLNKISSTSESALSDLGGILSEENSIIGIADQGEIASKVEEILKVNPNCVTRSIDIVNWVKGIIRFEKSDLCTTFWQKLAGFVHQSQEMFSCTDLTSIMLPLHRASNAECMGHAFLEKSIKNRQEGNYFNLNQIAGILVAVEKFTDIDLINVIFKELVAHLEGNPNKTDKNFDMKKMIMENIFLSMKKFEPSEVITRFLTCLRAVDEELFFTVFVSETCKHDSVQGIINAKND